MCYNSQSQYCQRSSTHQISSIIGYMIGVERQRFENEHEPLNLKVFQELEKDPDPRTIRNLCRVRTAIERNYQQIHYEIHYNMKNINILHQIIELHPIC